MITAVIVVICISKAGGSDGKESACNAGNPSSIPGLGRSPGKRNGNPLQYSGEFHGQTRGSQRVGHNRETIAFCLLSF